MSATAMHGDREDLFAIEEVARHWVRRISADAALRTTPDFKDWRDADPRHEDAFWEAWRVWQSLAPAAVSLDQDWRSEAASLANSPKVRFVNFVQSRPGRVLLPMALAATLALVLIPAMSPAPTIAVATPIGQNRTIALADGSHITVGAKSHIKAYMSGDERRVELAGGQAFFEVAHDRARPFVVMAGDAEIRVTGTKFDVRRVGDEIRVSVLEGRVEVRRNGLLSALTPRKPDQVLTAGLTSELGPGDGSFSSAAEVKVTPGDWRTGRLFYADTPLADILADAARYSPISLRAADEDLARVRVTASFRPGQIDDLVSYIEAALHLTARRDNDGGITFVRKDMMEQNPG